MSGAFESALAFIYDVALQRAAVVAGYSLLLYDYFLTLSDEVEYIWHTPRTLVKFIYLANRYIVLLGQTILCIQITGIVAAVTGGCEFYSVFLGVYILISLETAHVLVVLRAWAIWGGNQRILRSMVAVYVLGLVSIVATVSQGEDFSNFEPTVASVCQRPVPDRAWLFYFASLVVDSLIYCMTMSRLWSYRKTFKNGSLGLIQALIRCATAFYVVNVCYDVLGIVSWTRYQNSPVALVAPAIMIPILAICSQRVVHDLRQMSQASCSTQDLSQVVSRQVKAFALHSESADGRASVIPAGSSDQEGEVNSNTDAALRTDNDNELRLDEDARLAAKIPSLESRSYSQAGIWQISASSNG